MGQRSAGWPGCVAGAFRNALENAGCRNEAEAAARFLSFLCRAGIGTQSLDEFLVAVGLMEGHELDPTFLDKLLVTGSNLVVLVRATFFPVADLHAAAKGSVRLSRTRWAVQDRVEDR